MTHALTPAPGTPARPRRRIVVTVLAAALAAALVAVIVAVVTGASGPADAPAVLITQSDFQPGATPPCLEHQTAQPNGAYQGGDSAQPTPQLTFLAYYTAAGQLPFCDHQPPTDTDKAWAQLYADLTGSTDNVSTILN